MPHNCRALIFHCIDFRFGAAIKKWLEENHLLNDCDTVSLAGAAKNLADPKEPADAELVLRQIEISRSLHRIEEIVLMNHGDCGAYGGRDAFESNEAEKNRHFADLKKARSIISKKFPELKIRLFLAKISPLEQIDFEELR